ncbi:hypothetical protein [Leifsonia shinshuensis]|uniref:hypothetical protein n=1 Tax=Leifsonia TaxID=110932 RepID=UPI0028545A32|nr:hypothetical protein [Leifsonia shinshuensis]MDR6971227.1 hypothetical protein [Leifsonia shinshuensis]
MSFRSPQLRRTALRRTIAAGAVAACALTGLTACDLWAPQDTLYIESAIVGASATVGEVYVGNAVLVTGEDDSANLVMTLINQSQTDAQEITIIPTGGQTIQVSIPARATKKLGDPPSETTLVTGLDAKPGSLTTVSVTSGGNSVGLQVPVVTQALQPYGTLTPVPVPTSTSTSTPSPTPSPTPSK